MKPGAALVLGETDPALAHPFLERGAARVVTRGVDFGVRANSIAHRGRLLDLYTPEATYHDVFLALHGAHQADNAACALAAVECFLGRPLEEGLVADAFAAVQAPGRLEVVGHQPLVLLDGVKNVAGAHSLRLALAEEFADAPRTYVVGLMREKEPHEMLEALGITQPGRRTRAARVLPARQPTRAVARRRRRAAIELGVDASRIEVIDDVRAAVTHAIDDSEPDEQVVVTGSLYVVAPARAMLVP